MPKALLQQIVAAWRQAVATHLAKNPFAFDTPLAEVIASPLGLRNISDRAWKSSASKNPVEEVPPGYAVPLVPGMKIDFGSLRAEIRV